MLHFNIDLEKIQKLLRCKEVWYIVHAIKWGTVQQNNLNKNFDANVPV